MRSRFLMEAPQTAILESSTSATSDMDTLPVVLMAGLLSPPLPATTRHEQRHTRQTLQQGSDHCRSPAAPRDHVLWLLVPFVPPPSQG